MLERLRAVAFDLDDTLWEVTPVIRRAEERLHGWLREHCPALAQRFTPDGMREARLQLAREEPHRAHDLAYLRTTVMRRLARECGYDEALAEQAYEIFTAARNEVELYAEVHAALERLRSRYVLATLTNGTADLRRIGIAQHFAISLTARDVGVAKPDRRCFECLVAALDLEPHEVLYVGDNPEHDVAGARAAGLRTAWINRSGRRWPSELEPADLSLRDCLDLVRHLGA